jgi:flagellar basal body-associated protein FliL
MHELKRIQAQRNAVQVMTRVAKLKQNLVDITTTNGSTKNKVVHKLVLLVDDLIEIRSSQDWEDISTLEQDSSLQEIINSLDSLYFQVRNQVVVK